MAGSYLDDELTHSPTWLPYQLVGTTFSPTPTNLQQSLNLRTMNPLHHGGHRIPMEHVCKMES